MPVTVAPERLVNTVTEGAQRAADVAIGARTLAAWIDDSSGASVAKLRVFGADGSPMGGEIVAGTAREVAVTALSDGFVAVRIIQTGAQQLEVVAQRYDTAGQAVGGVTVLQNLDVRNSPTLGVSARELEVVALSDGGYVAGWSSSSFSSLGSTSLHPTYVFVRNDGVVEASQTGVGASAKTVSGGTAISFTELPDHQVLAVYRVSFSSPPVDQGGVFAQLHDLSGQKLGPAVKIDQQIPPDGGPALSATGIDVAALEDGQVVFAWNSGGAIYVSLYAADSLDGGGAPVRTPPVRLTTSAGAGEPQVVVLPDGRFVVGWNADQDVMAQVFGVNGQPEGAAQRIGTVALGAQDELRLAVGADGTVAALWQDASGLAGAGAAADPSGLGVKLELLAFEQRLAGTQEVDRLTGGAAGDVISGLAGDDVLVGAGGDDTLLGGVGGDSFSGGSGADWIDGGSNTDFVTYADAPHGVTVELQFGIGGGADPVGTDHLVSIEAAYGSAFGDAMSGNYLSNLLIGNDGADTIYGRSGTDYLDGGAGGSDLLVLDAAVTDYFVTNSTAQSARLVGPFGTVQALGFERVRIAGTEITWSEFTTRAFNGLRYVASNPDLIASIGTDAERARQHWVNTGQAEGRPLDTFDPLRYAASNPDLLAQYYIDTQALTRHYIEAGFVGGRSATSFDPLQYGAINADLLLAFGADAAALTRHYAVSGFVEGRPKTGFDPLQYGASNNDLARVFGADANALFQNWINSGVFEGRPTTGFDALQYAAANDDLARVFGTDQAAARLHWLNNGADEFRPTSGFDAVAYALSYPGEAGLSVQTAFEHWLTIGADQGLRGDELFGREQTSHALEGAGELRNFTTAGRFSADRDWFQISVAGTSTVRISAMGADSGRGTLADPRIEIYDASGRFFGADEDGGAGRDALFTLTTGGRFPSIFYVVVRSTDGGEGTYSLSMEYGSGLLGSTDDGWVV